jgi:hypothetical protein
MSAPVPRPVWDWAAANDKKNAAIAGLWPLMMPWMDIEAWIDELAAGADRLEEQ